MAITLTPQVRSALRYADAGREAPDQLHQLFLQWIKESTGYSA